MTNSIQIPKIKEFSTFQYLIRDLFKANNEFDGAATNGREGQSQNGVDVFARNISTQKWIGIQCKVKSTNQAISKTEMLEEINKAKNFNPKLSEFFIYTTHSRDARIQQVVREIKDRLGTTASFSFDICFWEDIEELLTKEEALMVFYKYFKNFFIDSYKKGFCVGKVVTLLLGENEEYDTQYPIILIKIPAPKEDNAPLSHYANSIFLININESKVASYTINSNDSDNCFETDIENGFSIPFDRYRICKLINNIRDIDDVLNSDEHILKYSTSTEEKQEYMDRD